MKPLVSVIIPNYNYGHYVSAAVESVLAQTYSEIEVLVVDDGSCDGSQEVLRSFHDRVQVVLQKNEGVASARNRGTRLSRGEFTAFLDADDIWHPEKIEKQMALFEKDPELGLVHAGLEHIDAEGRPGSSRMDGLAGRVYRELLLLERTAVLAAGSSAVLPRKVFDSVGGFGPRLSTSADWDFCFRVSRHYRIGFVAEPLLQYRIHGSNMHSNVERMEREMMLGYRKAFENPTSDLMVIRRRAYANLHRVLAGSYLVAGNYPHFVRHACRSLLLNPGGLWQFAGLPFRRLSRRSRD